MGQSGQWEILNEGIGGWPTTFPTDINFVNDKVGWLTGENSLLKTEDCGETWKEIKLIENNETNLDDIIMATETIGWAINNNKVFWTEDGGKTWRFVNENNNIDNYGLISASDDSVAFVGGNYGMGYEGMILKTTDAGDNWINISPDIHNRSLNEIQIIDRDHVLILGRVMKEFEGGWIERELCILRTKNGGESWDEILLSEFSKGDYAHAHGLQYLNDSTAFFLADRDVGT